MLELVEKPKELDTSEDIHHFVCEICDPDTGLCGTDVSGRDWCDGGIVNCVVCVDLEEVPCPKCGF